MGNLILILAGVAIGFWIGRKTAGTSLLRARDTFDTLRKKARQALADRTEERKEKILELLRREMAHQKELTGCNLDETKQGVTRNDVEKLLGVSDRTAGRYLDELEDEGKIKQVGTTGRGVYYILN